MLDVADAGDLDRIAVDERARSSLRPPAPAERGGRDDAELDDAVNLERDQGRPDRDPARVVPGAVDRVDDPAAAGSCGDAELLAEHAVLGALAGEALAERLLDRPVGLGHRRPVRLRLDEQVARAKAAERDRIGRIGEREGEREVGAHRSPDPTRSTVYFDPTRRNFGFAIVTAIGVDQAMRFTWPGR